MGSGAMGKTYYYGVHRHPQYALYQHPPAHQVGWMVSGQETVFCWVSVP